MTSLQQAGYALSFLLAHLALPYGGWGDARLEPKYIQKTCGLDTQIGTLYIFRIVTLPASQAVILPANLTELATGDAHPKSANRLCSYFKPKW
jgi:hypothetical protein